MDLRKFKLISAVLLAGALLFLSVIMMINKKEADNLPFSAAEDLSALFAARGVELPPELIPLRREKLPVYSLPAADGAEAQIIAETVSRSTRTAANLTEDGYLFRLENGGLFEISKFLLFTYNTVNAPNSKVNVTYPPTDTAKAKAAALLSRLTAGIERDDAVICDYTLTGYTSVESNTLLKFDMMLNGLEVADNSLTVYQNANGEILHASGKYAFSPLKKENSFRHYDIINVLKAEFDYITENGNPGSAIESIEACYVMRPASDGEHILLLPAWRIRYETGAERLYESAWSE